MGQESHKLICAAVEVTLPIRPLRNPQWKLAACLEGSSRVCCKPAHALAWKPAQTFAFKPAQAFTWKSPLLLEFRKSAKLVMHDRKNIEGTVENVSAENEFIEGTAIRSMK